MLINWDVRWGGSGGEAEWWWSHKVKKTKGRKKQGGRQQLRKVFEWVQAREIRINPSELMFF